MTFPNTWILYFLVLCVNIVFILAYDLLEEFRLSKSRGVRRVDGSSPEAVAYRINPSLHLKKSTRYLYPLTHKILFHSFCFSISNHVRLQTISLMSCFSQSSNGVIWTIMGISLKNIRLLAHHFTLTHCRHKLWVRTPIVYHTWLC